MRRRVQVWNVWFHASFFKAIFFINMTWARNSRSTVEVPETIHEHEHEHVQNKNGVSLRGPPSGGAPGGSHRDPRIPRIPLWLRP